MIGSHLYPLILALGLTTLVSACSGTVGGDDAEALASPLSQVAKAAPAVLGPKTPPVDPRRLLTRAAIDASPTPVLLTGLEARDIYATLSPAGTNRDATTWFTADSKSLTFTRDILIATRGLGNDLMGADVREMRNQLRKGTGSGVRVYDYLDGENQIVRRSFYCTLHPRGNTRLAIFDLEVATRHVTESCQNPELSFENEYWIGATGRIWQSRQWASPDIGYVFTQHLSR
ncbi:YjbF family lipoprotein [Sulfitobacter pacificus]|uniref:YjbF family lipoprotein n=1 Tax=Sulfitobacter pacificus TaxID=1499314 RepID=UPI003105C00E